MFQKNFADCWQILKKVFLDSLTKKIYFPSSCVYIYSGNLSIYSLTQVWVVDS